jgi:hypothetical protein
VGAFGLVRFFLRKADANAFERRHIETKAGKGAAA